MQTRIMSRFLYVNIQTGICVFMLVGLLQLKMIKFTSCSEASVIRLWTDLRIKRPIIPNFCVKIWILHCGNMYSIYTKVKGKTNRVQAWRGLRAAGVWISRQSAHESGKVVSPTLQPLFARLYSLYLFLVQAESTAGSSGIEPVNFLLVVQCLNQLRHCAPHSVYVGSDNLANKPLLRTDYT